MKRIKQILFFLLLIFYVNSLGQFYDPPSYSQFQVIKFTTITYFTQTNTTYNITPPIQMSNQPDVLISYDSFHLNHYFSKKLYVQSWHYIKPLSTTTTNLIVTIITFNETRNATYEYLTFRVLLSAVDRKYLHIINYQYTGPRLNNERKFWQLTLPVNPQPFNTCFIDSTHTTRQSLHFLLNINGYKAANLAYITRQINTYPDKYVFHFYFTPSLPIVINLYSDIGSWVDQYNFGLLFFCRNSYFFKRKYYGEIGIIALGSQLSCMTSSNFVGDSSYTLKSDYNFTHFIGLRFMFPYIGQTDGLAFQYEFDITSTGQIRYTNIGTANFCGNVQYNILFFTERKCQGNRQLNINTGICICDNAKNWYEIDSTTIQCKLVCSTNTYNFTNVCLTCQKGYNEYCLSCNNITCSQCMTNFTLVQNVKNSCICASDRYLNTVDSTCKLCTQKYGAYCLECNVSQCTVCKSTFSLSADKQSCFCPTLIQSGSCVSCLTVYGFGCSTCNSIHCQTCITDYKLFSSNNPSCKSCKLSFGSNCLDCDYSKCLSCSNGFLVSLTNGSCYCPTTGNYLLTTSNVCSTCSIQYNQYCLTCTQTSCTQCMTNFTLVQNVKNSCICASDRYLNTVDSTCKLCSEKYGIVCTQCNLLECLQCKIHFTLSADKNSCICLSYLQINQCISCSIPYTSLCLHCNQSSCTLCKPNYLINSSGYCSCQIDRYKINNTCILCSQTYGAECITCNSSQCLSCATNFLLKNHTQCICQAPNQLRKQDNSTNLQKCFLCTQLYSQHNCTLKIFQKVHQIGKTIYLQLFFNHPFNQLTQLIPFQQNLFLFQGSEQIRQFYFSPQHLYLKFILSQSNPSNLINITIFNKNYLKFNKIVPLNNNLQTFQIKLYDYTNQYLWLGIFEYMAKAVMWLYLIQVLFSFGQLNSGCQMWFILGYYSYISQNYDGIVEEILAKISQINMFQFINLCKLTIFHTQYKQVHFKQIIFNKNHTFIQLSIQGLIIFFISILFCIYLYNYIIKKSSFFRYGVYKSFINHFKQYIITNFISLYYGLALFIAIQLQYLIKINFDIKSQQIFVNLIITMIIGLVMLMIPIFVLNMYPILKQQNKQSYSVVYNKVHPTGKFQIIQYLLRVFNGPIYVIIIFCFRSQQVKDLNQSHLIHFILISLTLIQMFLCLINFRKYLSKTFWLFKFMKQSFLLLFQIGFMLITVYHKDQFEQQNQSHVFFDLKIFCVVLVLVLLCLDYVQFIVKILRIFIYNRINYEELYKDNRIMVLNQQNQHNGNNNRMIEQNA